MKKDRELEKSSLLLFVLMMTANAGNYLFQIVAGRLLSVADYGIFNSLNSLTGVLAVLCSAVAAVCCRVSARRSGGRRRLWRMAALSAAALLALMALLCVPLAGLLKIELPAQVFYCALSAAVGIFAYVPYGLSQGRRRFVPYGLSGVVGVAAKVVSAAVLIGLGLRIWGALASVTVYYLAMGLFLLWALRDVWREREEDGTGEAFGRYFADVLLVQLSLSLLTNGDVLLVKALFDADTAGLYASAAVIGKIPF